MKHIAIVTGASSGLGAEFIKQIISLYPQLDEYWVIARRENRLIKLQQQYPKVKIVPICWDLTDPQTYDYFTKRCQDKQVKVKILINNAGYLRPGEFQKAKPNDLSNMIDLNIKALTMFQRAITPFMCSNGFIVLTSSTASFSPMPYLGVYSASKSYVYSFAKSLREELKPLKINVLVLCPGNLNTEMNPIGKDYISKKISKMPYSDLHKVVSKTLKKASHKIGVYTPGFTYKFYRLSSKILPSACMVKITKKFF